MRGLALALGLAVLGAVWIWPLPALIPASFSSHMTLHMAVVAVAAPLVSLGVAGGAFDPVRRAPRWFPPVPASLAELLVVWVWHAPRLHDWARSATHGLVLEQAFFLTSGLWVWLAVLGGDGPSSTGRRGRRRRALAHVHAHDAARRASLP